MRQNFTLRLNEQEREKVAELAQVLDRSEGDAIRHVVSHATALLPAEKKEAPAVAHESQGAYNVKA